MQSKLSKEIAPFYVLEVLEKAREIEATGADVVHFEVGETDFGSPAAACEEAIAAINEGDTRYTHSLGIRELRSAIADDYRGSYGVDVSPDRIIVTMGSSPALFMSMLALVDPGDEIIITDPHYACYPQLIKIAGGVPKKVRIYEEEGFQPDVSRIEKAITPRTKAILVNSPANPTGVVLDPDVLRGIAGLGVPVISDEIYHGLVYSGGARTMLEFTGNAITVNGFSKLYAMTGWRLGYVIVPEALVRPVQKLQQNLFISPSPISQRAGVAALKKGKGDAGRMVKEFGERRKRMIEGLRRLGLTSSVEPTGAFYVFANVSRLSSDSLALAFDILEKAHVAVTPGADFGEGGEGYLRFSYAAAPDKIDEGLRRLAAYMEENAK
ncbi:MAG TPA: pyridoxal phosphate-dependent aminotransferase [Thermodesulfobacteriota bacterium]|nr:pyridoxal phosphate-dependent aminotransferase [Thermodesulfobacteriota bacterium]